MKERKKLLQKIEALGYRVTGGHDVDEPSMSGTTTIKAEHGQTGQVHTVQIPYARSTSELEALQQLAQCIGIDPV